MKPTHSGYLLLVMLISMHWCIQSQSVDALSKQILQLKFEIRDLWHSMHLSGSRIGFDTISTKVSVVKDFQKKLQELTSAISSIVNGIKQLPDEEFKKIRASNTGIFQSTANKSKDTFYEELALAKKKIEAVMSMFDKVIAQSSVVTEDFNKAAITPQTITEALGNIYMNLNLTFVR